jgi:hypothetical protein
MDCSSLKDACRAAEACVLSLDPEYVEDRRRWMRLTGRDRAGRRTADLVQAADGLVRNGAHDQGRSFDAV